MEVNKYPYVQFTHKTPCHIVVCIQSRVSVIDI